MLSTMICRFFAKYMSKNEDILKARQLMQQSLSHGASSPKLSKMLEVLLEHFSKYLFAKFNFCELPRVLVSFCLLFTIIQRKKFTALKTYYVYSFFSKHFQAEKIKLQK